MKKVILISIKGLIIGSIVAVGLSVLGHYKIWKFTNSVNDNLFFAALFNLVLSFLLNPHHRDTDNASRDFTTAIKYQDERKGKIRGDLGVSLTFILTFILLCALSYFLPVILI